MSHEDSARMWRIAGKYSALGIELATCVAFGTLGGNWLDQRFGSTPWLILLGFGIGLGAAVVSLRRVIADGGQVGKND